MKVKYEGPRDAIKVMMPSGEVVEHRKGQERDYPPAVAMDLLAEQRNKFTEVKDKK